MKYTRRMLEDTTVFVLREILREIKGTPANLPKEKLIENILAIQEGDVIPERDKRGRPAGSRRSLVKYSTDAFSSTVLRSPITVSEEEMPYMSQDAYGAGGVIETGTVSGAIDMYGDFGFIRASGYRPNPSIDVYVSKKTIEEYKLRSGDIIEGVSTRGADGVLSLRAVAKVNGETFVNVITGRDYNFDKLEVLLPDEKIAFDSKTCLNEVTVANYLYPLLKGRRLLISAPKTSGKKKFVLNYLNSIQGGDNVKKIAFLSDETFDNALSAKKSFDGELIYTLIEDNAKSCVRTAELALERAKRLIEDGNDVVLYIDGIIKLVKAYDEVVNATAPVGGISVGAIREVKKFLSAARKTARGSLTIIAACRTDSLKSDIIYDEISTVFNNEIVLDSSALNSEINVNYDKSYVNDIDSLLSESDVEAMKAIRAAVANGKGVAKYASIIKRSDSGEEILAKLENN